MHIAYLTNQYPKVSHSFIRREIRALEKRGIAIQRYSLRRSPDKLVDPDDLAEQQCTELVTDQGLAALCLSVGRTVATRPFRFARAVSLAVKMGLRSERGLARNLGYLASACRLREMLAEKHVRHLHAHFATNPAAVALLCQSLGGPGYSLTIHGPEEFDKPLSISLAEKVRNARFVAAVSHFTKSQIYRHSAYDDWDKVNVVRCGLDERFLKEPPTPPPDVRKLVCVGRLCSQKGQLHLVRTASQLVRRGVDFELILVGDGEMRPEVEACISANDLGDRVTITGWASGEEVKQHIAACRVLVMPSFAEGLPVAIMEAYALGRPVISTYVAGIPELVEPGKTGWLVPASSVDALADAVEEALDTPVADLARMGNEGRRRVERQHDIERCACALAELLLATMPADVPAGDG